jgi:hypothetical protein
VGVVAPAVDPPAAAVGDAADLLHIDVDQVTGRGPLEAVKFSV